MAHLGKGFWGVFLILTLASGNLWAQATAQISGTVRDQSGAVLPGVEVTATQTATGITRNTVSNETGSYVLSNLALGPYRLEAALPGFRTYAQTGIVLQVNSSPVINPVLEVGQVTEQVEVQANAALVETRTQAVGQVVENQRILELPLNGRDVQDLITLAGAAVAVGRGQDKWAAGNVLAVGGGPLYGTDYSLDGASHINFINGQSMPLPFPDAVQEFKVDTNGLSPQYSRGAQVSAVTKSGTNQFHGDLFEFVRNDLFNARSYFARKGSTLKRNQYGGTVGGPIARDKVFFFFGYQGTKLRADPGDNQAFIPTAAMMAGDWTAFASPACNAGRQIALRAPFVNNRIDPAQYSKAALFIANKLPKTADPCGLITFGARTVNDQGMYVGKVDYQKSARHSLFGRVMITPFLTSPPLQFTPDNILNSNTSGTDTLSQSYALGDTFLLGSNAVNSFRLAVNRSAGHLLVPDYFSWCDAGVNMHCYGLHAVGSSSVAGGFSIGTSFANGHYYINTGYSLNDDLSLVRGTHQMAFGGSVMNGRQKNFALFAALGQWTWNGQTTGLGMGDFFLGKPSRFFDGAPNPHVAWAYWAGLYATDAWKVRSNITLNYGIRWDPYLPQGTDAVLNFDYGRFQKGTKSTVFVNAPAGMYFTGDPGFPANTGVNKRWANFAPRLGLAWDVKGDGRTSVRASYSFGYTFVPGDFRETYSGSPPWGNRLTFTSLPGGFDNPYQGVAGGNPFPYALDKNVTFAPLGFFYTQSADLRTPNVESWNLSVQQQVAKDWLVSASYLANVSRHLWGNRSINPAVYIPGGACTINGVTYNPCSTTANTDQRRRLTLERPQDGALVGFMAEADDGGTQNYQGMLLSVQRRAASGVIVSGNYTLSHCIGPYATLYNPMGAHPNDTYTDPNNRQLDVGNCDSDRRHILNLTAVAETPRFSNPAVRTLATGWRFSGIYRTSAGGPLSVESGVDRTLTGIGHQRMNQVLASGYGDRSGGPLTSYLNPSAFSLPDLGANGNIGRNSLRGPRTWAFDVALSRIFQIREGQKLEFRAEAFNLTNSFRPGNPNAIFSSNTFGVIRTSDDPRIMQFALKYVF